MYKDKKIEWKEYERMEIKNLEKSTDITGVLISP